MCASLREGSGYKGESSAGATSPNSEGTSERKHYLPEVTSCRNWAILSDLSP